MATGIEIKFIGFDKAENFTAEMARQFPAQITTLFRSIGVALVDNVRTRIITRDGGQWAPASKWARAKTGYNFPTLLGAEKYVKMTADRSGVKVYGETDQNWTLTQHHEGFTNQLVGPDEERDEHGRVILQIKDPRPLNLYTEFRRNRKGQTVPVATVFLFKPVKPGVTPARKIWPTAGEAQQVVQPIASRWLQKYVADAGGNA